MDIIERIRSRQANASATRSKNPPPHNPEMLYIGCIDARLDPIDDIGIPEGGALIHRTIGALVAGVGNKGELRHLSEAASIEFAVKSRKVKHIVVSGHTSCGGMDACLRGSKMAHVQEYLEPLAQLRKEVLAGHKDHEERVQAMEEGAVRKSIANLMTYPFVARAVKRGELMLHGWMMDTASKRIYEMDPKTLAFTPMGTKK